jgi:protein gp37/ParB-like chromosome segregation protein Spo0J
MQASAARNLPERTPTTRLRINKGSFLSQKRALRPPVSNATPSRVEWIALDRLHPHPDNPRLVNREDVIQAIAANLSSGFDPAHALIVRPLGDEFQIISGHHRTIAASHAGLPDVPCWVREMDDDAAYMALVTCNSQSELSALEKGLHALGATQKGKHGRSVNAYAAEVGRPRQSVEVEIHAAEVYREVATRVAISVPTDRPRHLAEIHAAPPWLWSALVEAVLSAKPKPWTVEQTKATVARLKDAPETLPEWISSETPTNLIGGALRVADIASMIKVVDVARSRITGASWETDKFLAALDATLREQRPGTVSAVMILCNSLVDEQADHKREEEKAAAAELGRQEEIEAQARRRYQYVSLEEWRELDDATKAALLPPDPARVTVGQFNKQESAAIEWAQWSWNPLTGCLHDCPYCYARDIATSGRTASAFPNGFAPTLKPRSLLTPRNMHVPREAMPDLVSGSPADTRFRNVFTGSMADIFGRWVPDEWIEAVLAEIRAAPQWNFLCLTKFPKRMAEFTIPENAWMGTTVDLQARIASAEAAFERIDCKVKWLSCEPLIEPLRFKHLDRFNWIVIGGASRSTKTPVWRPPFEWVMDLVLEARAAGLKIYMKTNLFGEETKAGYFGNARILELPFDAPVTADLAKAPDVFQYLRQAP